MQHPPIYAHIYASMIEHFSTKKKKLIPCITIRQVCIEKNYVLKKKDFEVPIMVMLKVKRFSIRELPKRKKRERMKKQQHNQFVTSEQIYQ